MKKIKIVTDSTLDMREEDIKAYGVYVVPLSISIGEETFLDRVDISPADFMKKMKASSELPKTSQPSQVRLPKYTISFMKRGIKCYLSTPPAD